MKLILRDYQLSKNNLQIVHSYNTDLHTLKGMCIEDGEHYPESIITHTLNSSFRRVHTVYPNRRLSLLAIVVDVSSLIVEARITIHEIPRERSTLEESGELIQVQGQ
jgi:hypothetical protein